MRQALTNDEFLDELTLLLLREGITGLTVGEIAARVRCSRRRLYGIAATKEEIFRVILDRYFQGLLNEGEALVRDEQDMTEALAAYLEVGVRSAGRTGKQCVKDIEDCDATRASFDAYQQARSARVSQLIDEGVRKGVFVACHGAVVAELTLAAAMRIRRPSFLAKANLTMEEAFREFYRVLLGGLLVKAAGQKNLQSHGQTDGTIARTAQKGGSKKRRWR